MGFYIQTKDALQKAMQLKRDHGAQVVMRPTVIDEIPKGKTLICVVENGLFDAAGIVYSQNELEAFSETRTDRPRTFMLMDTEKVVELCPHIAEYLRGERSWGS